MKQVLFLKKEYKKFIKEQNILKFQEEQVKEKNATEAASIVAVSAKINQVYVQDGSKVAYLTFDDGPSTVNAVKETCGEKKHVVVLMHDAPAKTTTTDSLPQVIEYLKSEGYVFKTLDQRHFNINAFNIIENIIFDDF